MGLSDQINLKQLIATYLFANTPIYLYRHFRSNASLKELVEDNPMQELINEYNLRTAKETRSTEDVVIAYSILIAITFLEYKQALAAFQMIDLSRLDWGNEIKRIFASKTEIVNFFRVSANALAPRDWQTRSDSSTSTIGLDLRKSQRRGGTT